MAETVKDLLKADELPVQTMSIPNYNDVKSLLFDITEAIVDTTSACAREILPRFVTLCIDDPLMLWNLLVSFFTHENKSRPKFASILKSLKKFRNKLTHGKFIGLRDFLTLGSYINGLYASGSLTPDSNVLVDGAKRIAIKYLNLSRTLQLEIERKGYRKQLNIVMIHLHTLTQESSLSPRDTLSSSSSTDSSSSSSSSSSVVPSAPELEVPSQSPIPVSETPLETSTSSSAAEPSISDSVLSSHPSSSLSSIVNPSVSISVACAAAPRPSGVVISRPKESSSTTENKIKKEEPLSQSTPNPNTSNSSSLFDHLLKTPVSVVGPTQASRVSHVATQPLQTPPALLQTPTPLSSSYDPYSQYQTYSQQPPHFGQPGTPVQYNTSPYGQPGMAPQPFPPAPQPQYGYPPAYPQQPYPQQQYPQYPQAPFQPPQFAQPAPVPPRVSAFPPYTGPHQGVMTIRSLKEKFGPDKAKTLIIKIEDGESANKISRITRWNGSNCLVEILEDGHKVNLSLDKRHVSVHSEPN